MKAKIFSLFILYCLVSIAEDTPRRINAGSDTLLKALGSIGSYPLVLTDGTSKTPVLLMERFQSQVLEKLLERRKGILLYRLLSTADPMHRSAISVLLIDEQGIPIHLKTDQDVLNFVGKAAGLRNEAYVRKLIKAFADLRSYSIMTERPEKPDAREKAKIPAPLPTDYRFVVEDLAKKWRVFVTFHTDDHSGSSERYIFTIPKASQKPIVIEKPVLLYLRNYIM